MLDQLDTLIAFALIMLLISLLITTLVQSVTVVCQLREWTLLWGIQKVLENMGLQGNMITKVADAVASDPVVHGLVSGGATAIRLDELARLLQKVMANQAAFPPAVHDEGFKKTLEAAKAVTSTAPLDPQSILAVLNAVGGGLGHRVAEALTAARVFGAATPEALQDAITRAIRNQNTSLIPSPTLQAALDALANQVIVELTTYSSPPHSPSASVPLPPADAVRKAIEGILHDQYFATTQKAAELKAWFDMVMNRTTDQFVAWTRYITLGVSFLFCFTFQVDALKILRGLYEDKQVRDTLVAQVEPVLKQANEVLDAKSIALASRALGEMSKSLKDASVTQAVPADLDTRAKGEKWVNTYVSKDSDKKSLLKEFDDKFDELAKKCLETLGADGKVIVQQLSKSQLEIFPISGNFDVPTWASEVFCKENWRHTGGIVMAWLLVSLGAPFWFNMLKNLTNLRPVIAGKVDPPPQQRPSTPATG